MNNDRRITCTRNLPVSRAAYSPGISTSNIYGLKRHAVFLRQCQPVLSSKATESLNQL
jgi:hypothetical protein